MRIYYGWYIVAISMVLMLLSVGTTVYVFGLFVLPISREFGLSRASMNTGLIGLNFGMAALSPFIGRILDHRPIRLVLGVSALLLVGGFTVVSLSSNVWLSAAMLAGPIAAGVLGVGTLTTTALVARWFEAQRARAMAIAAMGMSLSPIIIAPVIGILLAHTGWRHTLMIEAACVGLLVALLFPFIRERPRPGEASHERTCGTPLSGQPRNEPTARVSATMLLRMPHFWTMTGGVGLGFGILQAIVISLVPYAQGSGFTITEAASLISVYGGLAIFGKILLAWLGDRADKVILLSAVLVVIALASAIPLLSQTYWALIVCSAVFGIGAGVTTPAFTALLAESYGAASVGTAYGTASTIMAITAAVCMRFGGEVYDRTGSYHLMFVSFAGLGAAAALIMAATRPLSARAARRAEVVPAGQPAPPHQPL